MIKTVFFFTFIISIFLISIIFLVFQFVPSVDLVLIGQSTLQCKPCNYHPECHCENRCVQQQIIKECNLGVDGHNTLVSHHTQENRTTRIVLIISLIMNFLQTLFFIFYKPIRHCCRTYKTRQRQQKEFQQQELVRSQAERYTIVLKQMFAIKADQPSATQSSDATSPPSLTSILSNVNLEH